MFVNKKQIAAHKLQVCSSDACSQLWGSAPLRADFAVIGGEHKG